MFDEDFKGRCVPFDDQVAVEYAAIVAKRTKIGRPVSVKDAQIVSISASAAEPISLRQPQTQSLRPEARRSYRRWTKFLQKCPARQQLRPPVFFSTHIQARHRPNSRCRHSADLRTGQTPAIFQPPCQNPLPELLPAWPASPDL